MFEGHIKVLGVEYENNTWIVSLEQVKKDQRLIADRVSYPA